MQIKLPCPSEHLLSIFYLLSIFSFSPIMCWDIEEPIIFTIILLSWGREILSCKVFLMWETDHTMISVRSRCHLYGWIWPVYLLLDTKILENQDCESSLWTSWLSLICFFLFFSLSLSLSLYDYSLFQPSDNFLLPYILVSYTYTEETQVNLLSKHWLMTSVQQSVVS